MIDSAMTAPSNALAAKKAQEKSYRKKGIFIALMSGFLYGGYTAFLTQGMASGIWGDYYGGTGVAAGIQRRNRNFCICSRIHSVCGRCGSKRHLFCSLVPDLCSDYRKTG